MRDQDLSKCPDSDRHEFSGITIDTYPPTLTCRHCGMHWTEGRGWYKDSCYERLHREG